MPHASKEAEKAYNQAYYKKNKDHIKRETREYRIAHRVECNEYSRAYQQRPEEKQKRVERQREYRKKYRIRFQARKKVLTALNNGELIKTPCDVCGVAKVEAHHADYTKPLEVRWLCSQHHREVEGRSLNLSRVV